MTLLFRTDQCLSWKVRDIYTIEENHSDCADRISALDIILPPIPYKVRCLTRLHPNDGCYQDIVPKWVNSVPDPDVTIGNGCERLRLKW